MAAQAASCRNTPFPEERECSWCQCVSRHSGFQWPEPGTHLQPRRGGNLPIVLIFVDYEEHVSRVLPRLREMAPHRLIVRENVVIEQGNLD